jgi:putative MATE family efflux protein
MQIKIVAQLGTSSVAAVTTGQRVFFLVQALLMGVSVAATAMVARSWGAHDINKAERVAWASLVMSVVLAGVVSIPVVLAPYAVVSLFGLDDETTALAASYVFWLGVFNIFTAINVMLGTALRATGDVITPLWYLLFSSILNVFFAYLLAFGIGPFPKLGVAGVSLGGSFGAALITLVFVIVWWRGHFNLKPVRPLRIDTALTRQLITIGAPSVIEQGIVQVAFLAFFAIVANYGTAAYAAYGIGITLVAFPIVIGFGFGIAAATLVGQHLGAGQSEAAVQAVSRSLRLSLAVMVALSVILAYSAEALARFMIDDPEVIHLTVVFMYTIAVAQPLMAFEFTLGGALRGAGDTRFPLVATLCGVTFGRLIPALIALWLGLSIYWIFSIMILDYSIKAALLIYRFRSRKWLDVSLDKSA